MKKMIFALVALMVCLPMMAQERVNRPKAQWIGEGGEVTKITGWGYDDTAGEWVECLNMIETKVASKKYAGSATWMAHTYNNIISLQTRTLEYQGDTLLVLVRERWEGEFRYPHIMKDWQHWKVTDYYVLSKDDVAQFRNLPNAPIHINMVTARKGRYEEEELDVDLIRKQVENESPVRTAISIYKSTDDYVRFVFQSSAYHERLKRLMTDIEKGYFEMTEDAFKGMFTIHN